MYGWSVVLLSGQTYLTIKNMCPMHCCHGIQLFGWADSICHRIVNIYFGACLKLYTAIYALRSRRQSPKMYATPTTSNIARILSAFQNIILFNVCSGQLDDRMVHPTILIGTKFYLFIYVYWCLHCTVYVHFSLVCKTIRSIRF